MSILAQFALRLSIGLAFAMCITSPRKVTGGFFRNHSYVLLGINLVALLAVFSRSPHDYPWHLNPWLFVPLPILSYASVVAWLYEKQRPGQLLLVTITVASLLGAWIEQSTPHLAGDPTPWKYVGMYDQDAPDDVSSVLIWRFASLSSGLLLGATIAAMFLGHWYLNSPTMEIAPLKKLVRLMAIATLVQAFVSGLSLYIELNSKYVYMADISNVVPLLALRWLAGIFGTAALTYMTWQTLKIPNTQSATGILYVAVLATFLGELTSLLLSASTAYPI